jgi:hypothetical protein
MDLEKLFLPAWAQESPSANRYAQHPGGEDARPERKRDFRAGQRPPRKDGRGREGRRPQDKDRRRPMRGDDHQKRERFEAPPPLPEVNVALVPDETGVESLARQIKTTGRAYPLFSIAQVVLQRPERYAVQFAVKKSGDGQVTQPLFVCALDETLWLSEDEVVAHVLRNHFVTFYQAERTATEPPRGKYTFVAQCGMSGAVLGPPNHHDYQNQLHKLHSERFANVPFEVFKSRVKIVRDEAVVKKWVEDQSWKTEYACLNVPESLKLPNMEEVEKHFRAVHKDAIVKQVPEHALRGVAARGMRCSGLARLARQIVEDQRHFPLQLATVLSQRFGSLGLQFFKVNRTFTHVCVARPNFLDLETTPVSDGVRRIVEFINAKPKCSRRQLVEALAPTPRPAVIEIKTGAATTASESRLQAAGGGGEPPEAGTPNAGPTPEQTVVIADLHWLIHQGHVIEFADGRLDTAKKPAPKPPKAEAKPVETTTETAPPESASEQASVSDGGLTQNETVPDAVESPDSATSAPSSSAAPQGEMPSVSEQNPVEEPANPEVTEASNPSKQKL